MGSTCRVVVRLKPKADKLDNAVQVIESVESPTLLVKKGSSEDGVYQFQFSRILCGESQREFHQLCSEDIVESVLSGYNGTIMAYGQTGSGKTWTMSGSEEPARSDPDSHGVTPRAIQQIFRGLRQRQPLHWRLRLSYLEIYNDAFHDLLAPETPSSDLSVLEHRGNVIVKNLKCLECKTVQEAMDILYQGQTNRRVAEHSLNARSSRSHTIISVLLDLVTAEGVPLASKLNLVDLAGSERFSKTGAVGTTAKEAMHINKSLTFLEQVIIALSKKRQQHVPYRSSKLTHFLKDSIGGNCKTLLAACVWSDAAQVNETLSTCRFAQRMLQVTEDAQQNRGGLTSVHGNLFKLDPVMQQYLEQMTASAVAREKAQLYAEFSRLRHSQGQELDESESQELEALRHKVKELEALADQARETHGRTMVDKATLEELEQLRRRVMDLELASAADAPVLPSTLQSNRQLANGPQISESGVSGPPPIRLLPAAESAPESVVQQDSPQRSEQVQDLSPLFEGGSDNSCSEDGDVAEPDPSQDYIELDLTRECLTSEEGNASFQAEDVSSKQEAHVSHDDAAIGAVNSDDADESDAVSQGEQMDACICSEDGGHLIMSQDSSRAAEISVLKDARGRLQQWHAGGHGGREAELQALRLQLLRLQEAQQRLAWQASGRTDSSSARRKEVAHLLECMQDLEHESLVSTPVRADRSPEIKPLQESKEGEGDHAWHVDDDKAEVLDTREQQRLKRRVAELEGMERRMRELEEAQQRQVALQSVWGASDLGSLRSPSFASTLDPDAFSQYGFDAAPGHQRKKKGFFAKLFGKDRTQEHDSFAHFAPPETLEADDAPTIVILNSLNHDQLLELLKARPVKGLPGYPLPSLEEEEKENAFAPITPQQLAGKPASDGCNDTFHQASAFQSSPSDSAASMTPTASDSSSAHLPPIQATHDL